MADILLINPPKIRPGSLMEHLGLGYLAATIRRAGFSAEIIDAPAAGLDFTGLAAAVKERDFRVLGVSILFQDNLGPTLSWLQSLRDGGLGAHIAIGGHPATFTYKEIMAKYPCVDSIVLGEGELTILELTEKITGGGDWRSVEGLVYRSAEEIILNPLRPLIKDLNELPWPARDVLASKPRAFDQLVVSASRGCPKSCSFCSIATFYRSFKGSVWRRRDPDDVFDEIDAARQIAPFKHVLLVDDTFIGPGRIGREKAFEFAEALGRRRPDYLLGSSCRADQVDEELFRELKKAGLSFVFLGIESGNAETLNLFHKESSVDINRKALAVLDKLGIPVEIGFIMFNPYTTFSQVLGDLDFLLETGCGPDIRHLSNLGLFPGQPILEKIRADNLLEGSPLDYRYKFLDKNVGKLFDSLRRYLLDDQNAFAPLYSLGQLIQAHKLGEVSLEDKAFAEAGSLISEFNRAFYSLIRSAADLFETGNNKTESLAKIKLNFTDRCSQLGEKARGFGRQKQPVAAP